jgi:uncharacterized membrane protein YkoI
MKVIWSCGTVAALVVALGVGVAARQQQQQTTKETTKQTTDKKATLKQAAKDDEKDEQAGTKKYTIAVQLPAPITAAFKKAYPAATIRGTAKETEDGKTVYEVESLDNGKARDLMYNADGTVISIEEEMNAADLPAPVTAALTKLYPKATITVAEKVTEGKTIEYELTLKGAPKSSVAFFPDGKLVPPEAPEKK